LATRENEVHAVVAIEEPRAARTFPRLLQFVCDAARLIGNSLTLQHARAKPWIALSCIHANLACHCVAVRQRNTYNARDSIRDTDILIGQSKIDSGLAIKKKSEQSDGHEGLGHRALTCVEFTSRPRAFVLGVLKHFPPKRRQQP